MYRTGAGMTTLKFTTGTETVSWRTRRLPNPRAASPAAEAGPVAKPSLMRAVSMWHSRGLLLCVIAFAPPADAQCNPSGTCIDLPFHGLEAHHRD